MEGKELITRIQTKGASELEPLYVQYRPEFVGWVVKSWDLERSEAKDIYQQTIITLYENVVNGRVTHFSSSVKTYLFAIGKNKVREWIRASDKRTPIADNFEPKAMDDSNERSHESDLTLIETGMQQLGEPCSRLLKHFYYDKWSMVQIAGNLGYKNVDTAKTQKHKCLQRLRKLCTSLKSSDDE